MAIDDVDTRRHCPRCGASIRDNEETCWLCEADLQKSAPVEIVEFYDPAGDAGGVASVRSNLDAMGAFGVFVSIGLVWLGVTLIAPGVGIVLAIAAVPAVIRTIMVVSKRNEMGKETSAVETGLMFLTSVLVSGIMVAAAGFVAFWTFCLTCVGAFVISESGPRVDENVLFAIVTIITIVVALGVLLLFTPMVRKRYWRDIEKG